MSSVPSHSWLSHIFGHPHICLVIIHNNQSSHRPSPVHQSIGPLVYTSFSQTSDYQSSLTQPSNYQSLSLSTFQFSEDAAMSRPRHYPVSHLIVCLRSICPSVHRSTHLSLRLPIISHLSLDLQIIIDQSLSLSIFQFSEDLAMPHAMHLPLQRSRSTHPHRPFPIDVSTQTHACKSTVPGVNFHASGFFTAHMYKCTHTSTYTHAGSTTQAACMHDHICVPKQAPMTMDKLSLDLRVCSRPSPF